MATYLVSHFGIIKDLSSETVLQMIDIYKAIDMEQIMLLAILDERTVFKTMNCNILLTQLRPSSFDEWKCFIFYVWKNCKCDSWLKHPYGYQFHLLFHMARVLNRFYRIYTFYVKRDWARSLQPSEHEFTSILIIFLIMQSRSPIRCICLYLKHR